MHHKKNNIHIVYPGSLEPMRFGESGEKGLTIVDLIKDDITINRNLEGFNKKYYSDINLNIEELGLKNEDDIIIYMEKKFKNPNTLVRLTLNGIVPFIISNERLTEQLSPLFFYLKVIDKTEFYNENMISSLKNEKTIRSIFVKKLMNQLSKTKNNEEKEIINQALKMGLSKLVSLK